MSASFSVSILGWRKPQGKNIAVPNIADSDNDQSIAISELILHQVGVPKSQIAPARKDPGKILEDAVCDSISASLSGIPRCQDWIIERGRKASTLFTVLPHEESRITTEGESRAKDGNRRRLSSHSGCHGCIRRQGPTHGQRRRSNPARRHLLQVDDPIRSSSEHPPRVCWIDPP